jgi:hypothetical protein
MIRAGQLFAHRGNVHLMQTDRDMSFVPSLEKKDLTTLPMALGKESNI